MVFYDNIFRNQVLLKTYCGLNRNIMRATGIILVLLLFNLNDTFAQKFGYVDSDYILSQMPEYQEAKTEIDKVALEWEQDIAERFKEIQEMESALKAEEVLLTKEMKDDRRKEIDLKWAEVKEYQKKGIWL